MKLVVIYDADCAFCTLCVRRLQWADVLSLVSYKPGHFRPDQRIQSVNPDGTVREGMDVMVQIACRSPLLWPLLPLLILSRLFFGQRPYDFVAARRHKIIAGTCKLGEESLE